MYLFLCRDAIMKFDYIWMIDLFQDSYFSLNSSLAHWVYQIMLIIRFENVNHTRYFVLNGLYGSICSLSYCKHHYEFIEAC